MNTHLRDARTNFAAIIRGIRGPGPGPQRATISLLVAPLCDTAYMFVAGREAGQRVTGVAYDRHEVPGRGGGEPRREWVSIAETKEIVCLANSVKHAQRCVAGIEVIDHRTFRWVRPVSSRGGHGVSWSERRLQDGSEVQVLDVVVLGVVGAQPEGFQQENWLLDSSIVWRRTDRADWAVLTALQDRPTLLWINGPSSTYGRNDRIADEDAAGLRSSLVLIRVDDLTISVQREFESRGVRAAFQYGGVDYVLRVTDAHYRSMFLGEEDGSYPLGEAFLTISLGEPFKGHTYKLAAAIMPRSVIDGPTPA